MIEFYGVHHYLESDARSWEASGIRLPAPIAQVFAEAHTLGDRVDLLERPAPVNAETLHRTGTPAREAVLAVREYEVELAAHDLERNVLGADAIRAATRVNKLVAVAREELIGLANEALQELLGEAEPLLKNGVPNPETILASGKEGDLRRLRELRSLEARWASIRTAHDVALRTHARTAPNLPCGLTDINPAHRYFARPDLVRDDVLAGRTRARNGSVPVVPVPTLTDLATQPDAVGVRLATWADIQRVYGILIRTAASRVTQLPFLGVGHHDALPGNLTDGLVIA